MIDSHEFRDTTGISVLLLGLVAIQVEPSLRAARQHLLHDRLDAARGELLALASPERPDRAELWASLHLAIAKKATEPEAVRHELTLGERFHQGLGGQLIAPAKPPASDNSETGEIRCRSRLGGLLNFYQRRAA